MWNKPKVKSLFTDNLIESLSSIWEYFERIAKPDFVNQLSQFMQNIHSKNNVVI